MWPCCFKSTIIWVIATSGVLHSNIFIVIMAYSNQIASICDSKCQLFLIIIKKTGIERATFGHPFIITLKFFDRMWCEYHMPNKYYTYTINFTI